MVFAVLVLVLVLVLLEGLFYHGAGGIGLGLAGGLLTAGVGAALGLGAKKEKINTIANVVNSKVGLLNLKTNIVRAGIEGAGLVNSLLGGEEEEEEKEEEKGSSYPRYPSYRRSYYQRPRYYSSGY